MKAFKAPGFLAFAPKALTMMFVAPQSRANARLGNYEVVEISGPLLSGSDASDPYFDDYQSIKERVQQACMSDATAVVLLIDSPGGQVHNCFETSRQIKAMCEAAGKPLIAYIDSMGCSAAYCLASAASKIIAAETSDVGSIGVIQPRYDVTEAMAREGVKVSYITSGEKKSYGNPETPMTEGEDQDTRRQINLLAGIFFNLVAENRGLSPEAVASYQAGCFIGREAQVVGLVDEIGTFDSVFVSSPKVSATSQEVKAVSLQECIEALAVIAASDGDDSDKAKEMLGLQAAAAESDEPKKDDESSDSPDGDEPPAKDKEDDKKDDKSATSSISDLAAASDTSAAELAALRAEVEALKAKKVAKRAPAIATLPAPKAPPAAPKSEMDIQLDKAFGLYHEDQDVTVKGNVVTFPISARKGSR